MCMCVFSMVWPCMCLNFFSFWVCVCANVFSEMCVSTCVCVSHTNGAPSPAPRPRGYGEIHIAPSARLRWVFTAARPSLNPVQGSFAYWGCVCMCVCPCVYMCVWMWFEHQPVSPAQKQTGGWLQLIRIHCYFFTGDSAAKISCIHACTHSGSALSNAGSLLTFYRVLVGSKLLIGWVNTQ